MAVTSRNASGGGSDTKSHALKLWILCTVPFIMVLGNSMLIPVMPKMMAVMHLTLFQVGLVITMFSIPAGIIIPLAGALSDRIGRRIIMGPSLIIYGLGGLAAGVSAWLMPHPYPWIMGSRLLQGIGAGGTYQLAMAVAGDMYQSGKRASALGLLEAANGLGKVISPIAGSALALAIWFLPFFAYGMLSFPVAVLVWFVIKEPSGKKAKGGVSRYWQGLKYTFRQKGGSIFTTFLGGAVVLFVLFGVLSYLADILEKGFGYGEIVRGMLIAIPVLASAITSYVSGTVLQKKIVSWARRIVVLGLGLIAAALVLEPLFITKNVAGTLVILVFQGIGTGSVLPSINTMVTSATTSQERGVVTSLYGSVRFFGVAMGPPLFSLAMTHRYTIFWAVAGLTAATALLAFFAINERQMLPKTMTQNHGASRPKTLKRPRHKLS